MILIISHDRDEHVDAVVPILHDNDIAVYRFDTSKYPQGVELSFRISDSKHVDLRLFDESSSIALQDVTTVWYRRPTSANKRGILNDSDRQFVDNEVEHYLRSIYTILSDRYWVNPITMIDNARGKPEQLCRAKRCGFRVPRTLITTSPDEARDFVNSITQRVIYKPLHSHARPGVNGALHGIYTTLVTDNILQRFGHEMRYAPCLFQEYIDKQIELRVTVIGQQLFTAAIESQRSERSKYDWRRYDVANTPYKEYSLTEDMSARIAAFVASYGLYFCCIDLIVTPDNEIVFLEMNPNGQWLWIEYLTHMPLRAAMASLLARRPLQHSR